MAGAVLEGRFQVVSELGHGAFSTVVLATDLTDGSQVAIKIIPEDVFQQNWRGTLREVEILKNLSHPNIIKLHAAFQGQRYFAIVMELLTGGQLFERIVQKQRYPEKDAREVMRQLLRGIEYLHANSVAHRDLKPENIIFTDGSEGSSLKITDFGFANIYDPSNMFCRTCGTPLYVAPEVISRRKYDVKCDLWSLGVIAYILLCGFPPFYGETEQVLYAKIKNAEFSFPSPYWDSISIDGKDFIRRLLVSDPTKRLNATQALHHPWITGVTIRNLSVKYADHLPLTIIELKRYNALNKLVKGITCVVALNRLRALVGLHALEEMQQSRNVPLPFNCNVISACSSDSLGST